MSKRAGGRLNRNILNLTLPSSITGPPSDDDQPPAVGIIDSAQHSSQLETVCPSHVPLSDKPNHIELPLSGGEQPSTVTPCINGSLTTVTVAPPIIRTRNIQSSPSTTKPPGLHVKVVAPDPNPSTGNRYRSESHNANRISTAPVDVAEVLRQLEAQDLDDLQRRQLSAFVTEKQKIGELRPEDFERICELGKGNGGVVSKVRHIASGLMMAKKNIHLEVKPVVRTRIIRELQVLHDCNSPYIVGYYGAFFADGSVSLCMEYMDGGSLDRVLTHAGRIPEPIVAKILYSVLKGLVYLSRSLNIIHRDVKPSNILVKRNGDVKLCDFGVSGQLTDSMANSFVGTRSYMAPERLSGEQYNVRSDVWSLGLSVVELTTGRFPIPAIEDDKLYLTAFSPDRETNLAQHLDVAKYGRPLPPVTTPVKGTMAIFELLLYIVNQPAPKLPRFCFSDDLIDLVDSCLRRSPDDRPSLDMLLQHRFVTTVAGAVPTGSVHRQSIVYNARDGDVSNLYDDPIHLGNYLCAVLPPLPPEVSNS